MDETVLLSRVQFALTIMFHYLFPPLAIGMGVVLVYLEGRFLWTKRKIFESAAKFWVKIFALNFAVGVATGIVMEFEFGTNWATYSRFVGDVFGSALAAEGIFAFFLESGFLAVLVFGWDRVGPRMHFFSTIMVALGSIFSSIWIVVANSWQQTPAGHHIVPVLKDGAPWVVGGAPLMRAEIVDFWSMVFNPSTVHRLVHVWLGCFIMGAFFIMSISAWYVLRRRHLEFAHRSFSGALALAAISSLAILASGHFQADNVAHTQPAKLAAFEGHYRTGPGDLHLFGIPNDETETVDLGVAIPGGLSFLLHQDFEAPVVGLDRFRPEDRPPTLIPFFSYHVMIGLGVFFIAITLASLWWLKRGTLFTKRWLMWIFVFAVVGAVAANQTGWVAAEVGRQPWIVQAPLAHEAATGVPVTDPGGRFVYEEDKGLRTTDGVSKVVRREQVAGSIIGFSLVYLLLAAVWVFVLNNKIQKGPEPVADEDLAPPGPTGYLAAAADRAGGERSMTETDPQNEG
jgi:cytochrome d ubiquinol oxidase subunit I